MCFKYASSNVPQMGFFTCAASTLANDLKESCLCHYFTQNHLKILPTIVGLCTCALCNYFTQNHLNAGFKNPPHSSWPSGFPSPVEKGEEKVVFSGRNTVRVFFLCWSRSFSGKKYQQQVSVCPTFRRPPDEETAYHHSRSPSENTFRHRAK